MLVDPTNTTIGDICQAALKECGAVGIGQTALYEDINDAWARLQWMLMQWERKRWLVYHLRRYQLISTGQMSYTIGPGGEFDTGAQTMRPTRISSAFVRQQYGQINPVDYQLQILQSMEDYNWITLKSLQAGPGEAVFLDTDWPLAHVYIWPIPQAHIYEIHLTVNEALPYRFFNPSTPVDLPFEYYNGLVYNLAMRLRPKYRMGTYPGDPLPGMAKDSLAVIRVANTQVAKLRMPATLRRRGLYNIFSDRPY